MENWPVLKKSWIRHCSAVTSSKVLLLHFNSTLLSLEKVTNCDGGITHLCKLSSNYQHLRSILRWSMLSMIDCIVRSKACFLSTANQMAMSLIEAERERMMPTSCRWHFGTLPRSSNSWFFLVQDNWFESLKRKWINMCSDEHLLNNEVGNTMILLASLVGFPVQASTRNVCRRVLISVRTIASWSLNNEWTSPADDVDISSMIERVSLTSYTHI